jgi:hypothetical protein
MYTTTHFHARIAVQVLLPIFAVCAAQSSPMQFTQQGPKLVGTGYAAASPQQGRLSQFPPMATPLSLIVPPMIGRS